MNFKNIKLFAVIPLSLWTAQAMPKSMLVTGALQTVSPKVTMTNNSLPLANVSEFSITAKGDSDSGCVITGDPSVAKDDNGDNLVCLFEWVNLPTEMNSLGLTATGYLQGKGIHTFDYQISYLSGSRLEKVKISEGSVDVDAVTPEPPFITGVTTSLTTSVVDGFDVINYRREAGLLNINVQTEKRPYSQLVTLEDVGECIVKADESSCDIDTFDLVFGGNGEGQELQGMGVYELKVDSTNGYFSKENLTVPINYSLAWDYRPPELVDFKLKAKVEKEGAEEVIDIGGLSLTIENDQAKLIVQSPHEGEPGEWWVPSAKLELNLDPTFEPVKPVYEIDGRDVVNIGNMVSKSKTNFVVNPTSLPEIIDGKFVFTFDLKSVSDGKFIPRIVLNDVNNNYGTTELESVYIDRKPPSIQLIYKKEAYIEGEGVYFFEDMIVIALDTFDGEAEILSAKINGIPMELEGELDFAKTLKGADLKLKPLSNYPLSITVKDKAGNISTQIVRIEYMPIDFAIEDSDTKFYRKAQRLDLDIEQLRGDSCSMYSSRSEIELRDFMYGESLRCYVEWMNTPNGSSGVYNRGVYSLMGNLHDNSQEATNEVGFRVWMINEDGVEALAAEVSENLNVEEPPAPEITISQKNAIKENVFPVDLTGSRFATVIAKGINADLELSIDDGYEESVYSVNQRSLYYDKTASYQGLRVGSGNLWDTNTFEISSKYTLAPEVETNETVQAFYVPSGRIRGRISTLDTTSLDTVNPIVSMTLGIYDNEQRAFVYNKDEQGVWDVYLAVEERDPETRQTYYVPITDEKVYSGSSVNFEVDVSDVGYGSYRFLGVARLRSEVEGYERTIITNSSFYRVLKGGKLDGIVKTYRMASKVPFTASLTYQSEEREDREALGDIDWLISLTGTGDWKSIPEYKNQIRLRQLIEKPDHYFVRAIATNKLSGVKSSTDMIEIVGYEVPELDVDGPSNLYEGEEGTLVVKDNGEIANLKLGTIEWSMDGDNWEEGTNIKKIVGTGRHMTYWVRMSYNDTEIVGKARFGTHRHRISVTKPKPVRITTDVPRMIEAGKSYELKASVRLASSQLKSKIIGEWELPDGTLISGDTLTYTPTDTDAEVGQAKIKYHAWVDKLKEDTYAAKDVYIKTWKYKFSDFRFDLNYRTRYAPIDVIATIRQLDKQPGDVEYTYDYEMFDGLEVERKTKNRLYFTANKPGIYPFTVIVKDDRGGEKRLMEVIEVIEPPETKIDLFTNYSTKYMRQPLDVSIRASVKLGHPQDRVDKYEWFLDGKVLEEQNSLRASIDNLEAGEHRIKVIVTSKFGVVKEDWRDVEVAPNEPPVCNLSYKLYGRSVSLKSGCEDSDGKMLTHNWFIDGELIRVHANNVSVIGTEGERIDVRVVGFDDSGDSAEDTLNILPDI